MKACTWVITSMVILTIITEIFADVPNYINFQGTLTDSSGNPITGTETMTFSLYTDTVGVSSMWSETHTSVELVDGLFRVQLGSVTPLLPSLLDESSLWLGITVSGNSEMSPLMQVVSVAYSYRVGTVDGATGGTISGKLNIGSGNTNSGSYAFVTGEDNMVEGNWSSIGGGYGNVSIDDYCVIAGGHTNTSTDMYSVIGGGASNATTSSYSTISGGQGNTASGDWATVGGGHNNEATGLLATISGGYNNDAIGASAAVGGGASNLADTAYTTVGGGQVNVASGYSATVGGGWGNGATGNQATVGGGYNNGARGGSSTVGGGASNLADTTYATVGGGGTNMATNFSATVSGGYDNSATERYSTVCGGFNNDATGYNTFVGGGYNNDATGYKAAVVGGDNNLASSDYAVVGGGQENEASNNWTTVSGGRNNIASFRYATVGGGQSNIANEQYATVGGGQTNVASGYCATVPGGCDNTAQGWYSFAAGRRANATADGAFVWGDNTDADITNNIYNRWMARASNGFYLYTNASLTSGTYIPGGGSNWYYITDSTMTRNLRLVDTKSILDNVAQLPIKQWSYNSQDPSIEHIGPMAQDFYKLFHFGADSLGISTIDLDGISLAAIQELHKENQQLKQELNELRSIVEKILSKR